MTTSRLQQLQNDKTTKPTALQRDEAARDGSRPTSNALSAPHLLSPANLKTLQRSHGNRAVSQLIQTKLTVGPVGDRYEQEADRIAKQVVNTQTPAGNQPAQRQAEEEELQAKPLADRITPIAQRQAKEEEELQAKPVQRQAEEEELQMQPIQRQAEEEELQMQPVQRQEEEEELQMQPLQRQAEEEELQMSEQGASAEGGPVSADVEDAIQRAKGGGRPLAEGLRTKMESGFGTDFGGVRVHDDSRSDDLNRSLRARAFTTGQDIFFKQGEYDPDSSAGQELIAHELTHVVQQTGAK